MTPLLTEIRQFNALIRESVHQQDWPQLSRLHDERALVLQLLLSDSETTAHPDTQQLLRETLVMDKSVMGSIAAAQSQLGQNALSLKLCQTASNHYQQTADL